MASNASDVREYLEYTARGMVGNVTRGIVVSNEDPLFSGRVKVWIPTLHGGNYDEANAENLVVTGNTIPDPANPSKTTKQVVATPLGSLSKEAIAGLPWAPVLGHNWGSVGKFASSGIGNIDSINYGLFSTPRVGTEVMLIFENDDPDFPVVIGSCIQRNEFLWHNKFSLEVTPGLRAAADKGEPLPLSRYEGEVANSLIIQASNGARLMFSDSLNREAITLMCPILTVPEKDPRNTFSDISADYDIYLNNYPGFPSTASSPYMSAPKGSITFVNGLVATSVTRFDTPPTVTPPATTSNTPADGTPPATPPPPTPAGEKTKKTFPVPGKPAAPTGVQCFGAPRPNNRKHPGIDLSAPVGTPLLAPVDGVVLYGLTDPQAGKFMGLKGVDGSIHQFAHLNSIDKIGKTVKLGEQIGTTGNTGAASRGAHLHWDIVMDKEGIVTNDAEARAYRRACAYGGDFKNKTIQPFNFVNPLDWLVQDSITLLSGDQLQGLSQASQAQTAFNNLSVNDNYRNMGIEMTLVTGRESIFLRHPSGGFFGFDADGNFMLHTTGDANFKVGRSANWNVFGAFLLDCTTLWQKVTSVARLFASSFRHTQNILDNEIESRNIPEFFKRNVSFKKADMDNALAESKQSTWIVDNRTGKAVNTLEEFNNSDQNTPPDPTQPLVWGKKFSEAEGRCKYADFKVKVLDVAQSLQIDPNWLMAVMYAESGLSPKAANKAGTGRVIAIGLIQFTDAGATEVGTTKAALAEMTAIEQLDYVRKYFRRAAGKMKNVQDVYAWTAWPKALGQPDSYVMYKQGDINYELNKNLDLAPRDGKVTRGELTQRALKYLADGKAYEA